MSRILTVYPNCSMGGMTTVYKNRIKSNPNDYHNLVFANDHGARGVFDDLTNARVEIPAHGRLDTYVRYSYETAKFDEVRVTSLPETANHLLDIDPSRVVYEFHSSNEKVIEEELSKLNLDKLSKIVVPSLYLRNLVDSLMPPLVDTLIQVVENKVDESVFSPTVEASPWEFAPGSMPLVWIGRFDKGKNPRDFLRVLSLLPVEYFGILIVSMESEPHRAASFLADVAAYGLDSRVKVMMNLPQVEIASLYRFVASNNGAFVSTSLGESFGFGVAEALACGLDTVAYEVGALSERTAPKGCKYVLVDVGDITGLSRQVARLQEVSEPRFS